MKENTNLLENKMDWPERVSKVVLGQSQWVRVRTGRGRGTDDANIPVRDLDSSRAKTLTPVGFTFAVV